MEILGAGLAGGAYHVCSGSAVQSSVVHRLWPPGKLRVAPCRYAPRRDSSTDIGKRKLLLLHWPGLLSLENMHRLDVSIHRWGNKGFLRSSSPARICPEHSPRPMVGPALDPQLLAAANGEWCPQQCTESQTAVAGCLSQVHLLGARPRPRAPRAGDRCQAKEG